MRRYVQPILVLALLIAGGYLATKSSALEPLFERLKGSPETLVAVVGSFALFMGFAALTLFQGIMREARERAAISFLKEQINDHQGLGASWTYRRDAPSVWESGLLGSAEAKIRQFQKTITGRVISLIYNDARFFRFEPAHMTLRTETGELSRFSNRITSYQTMAIRVGILGTFVGLIGSLGQVQRVFALRGSEIANTGAPELTRELAGIQEEIKLLMGEVVQGLTFAFGTSVAGILAAICIVFVASIARSRERQLMANIQEAAQAAQLFIRSNSGGNEELIKTAGELRNMLKDNLANLGDAQKNISINTELLSGVAGRLGDGLSAPLATFATNVDTLDKLLTRSQAAAETASRLHDSVKSVERAATASLEGMNDRLVASSKEQAKLIADTLLETRQSFSAATQAMASGIEKTLSEFGTLLATSLKQDMSRQIQENVLNGLLHQLEESRLAHRALSEQFHLEARRRGRQAMAAYVVAVIGITTVSFFMPALSARINAFAGPRLFSAEHQPSVSGPENQHAQ